MTCTPGLSHDRIKMHSDEEAFVIANMCSYFLDRHEVSLDW